ncbi:MAG: DUF3488 and transglutaminase-like domain-containing protein [Pseudomonadota bacterium]
MRFERYLRLCSTLLILTGFYSILITASYTLPVLIGMAVAVVHGFLGDRLPRILRVPKLVWNVVALGYLAFLLYDTFYGEQDLVGNGIKFVVYLQAVKLLSPKTDRDWLQIYLLSFMHILAATVISNDLGFAVPFVIYVVLATWTLVMFNLRAELGRATEKKRLATALAGLSRSRDTITPGFLAFTSMLSISVIGFTLFVFFSFPRVSFGNYLKRVQSRQRISGFSENVELGAIGNIKTSSTVSLRVEFAPEDRSKLDLEHLYWRGTASDVFDGRRWKKSMEGYLPMRVDTDPGILSVGGEFPVGARPVTYRVFLEALNPPILFGLDHLVRIVWDKPLVERIFRGSIALAQDAYGGRYLAGGRIFAGDLTYTGASYLKEPGGEDLKRATGRIPASIRSSDLQLPPLDPDVLSLLKRIPGNRKNPYDIAQSLTEYLQKNYRYTLNVQDFGVEDPLRFFLLDRKRGHCEYFSTALAIGLRVNGIPARQVVGFRGGDFNPYGGYIAVRESDAHSWVEAYFPGLDWVRFDPTPLDSTIVSRNSRFKALAQFVDYLRLRWNKYIIEYDLRSQVQLFQNIGRRLYLVAQHSSRDREPSSKTGFPVFDRLRGINPLWFVFGLALLGGLWRMISRRRRTNLGRGKAASLLKVLRRSGFQKAGGETLLELSERVAHARGEMPRLKNAVRLCYEERFGGRTVKMETWEETLRGLSVQLRHQKKPGSRQSGSRSRSPESGISKSVH